MGGIGPANEDRGLGTILLVDDDQLVLDLAHQVLRAARYEVFKAASAAEALDKLSANCDKIDLLITDLVMPDMTGDQLICNARKTKPGLPFIVMSGNAPSTLETAIPLVEGTNFVRKPFTIGQIREAVGRQLQFCKN